jgi:SAM-dependent methyltransferase
MRDIYADGAYLAENPDWHEEDSQWKAQQIGQMLQRHAMPIRSVAEIGCGVGGVLAELQSRLRPGVDLQGFDISAAAIAQAKTKERDGLHFHHEDLLTRGVSFDLLLIMDVIEHVPDYLGFLDGCRRKARYKLYHIPLDIHVSSVLRGSMLRARAAVGHIHYFTAESALASLADTGHRVIDSFYTNGALGLADLHPSMRRTMANIPRRLISTLSTAWAARLLGGYSLLVLTE